MKLAAATILLLIVLQACSLWAIVMQFKTNQDFIAKELCRNRARPEKACKGKCFLVKEAGQQQDAESGSGGKISLPETAPCCTELPALQDQVELIAHHLPLINTPFVASTLVKSVFHPPAVG